MNHSNISEEEFNQYSSITAEHVASLVSATMQRPIESNITLEEVLAATIFTAQMNMNPLVQMLFPDQCETARNIIIQFGMENEE